MLIRIGRVWAFRWISTFARMTGGVTGRKYGNDGETIRGDRIQIEGDRG